MTPALPPSSPQVVNGKEAGPEKRLSLAVARLDDLIARLNHLSEFGNQPFSRSEGNQRLSQEIPIDSVTSIQENSENYPTPRPAPHPLPA